MSDVPALRGKETNELVQQPAARMVPEGHSYAEPQHGNGSGIEQLLSHASAGASQDEQQRKQGYIVGRFGNQLLRLSTDGHVLTIAPTRSGKGVSCIIPNLLDHPGSAFVIDIRGDTIARTADARLLMGHDVVVLDPYHVTGGRWGYDSYNPLDILNPSNPDFDETVERLSQVMMFDPEGRSSKEPIWDNSTILVLNGALTYIKECLPPERQTLHELRRLFSVNSDKKAAIATEIVQTAAERGVHSPVIDDLVEFLTDASEKTKIPDNAFVQIKTILKWAARREFTDILAHSSFSFASLQQAPTTVYVVVPEEKLEACAIWIRLLFDAAFFELKEVTSVFGVSSNKLKQSQRVLFLLDEFPGLGRLKPVQKGMATVAGKGATLWLFIQHISQLDAIYGEHDAKQIIGNASLIQAFNSNEINELDYFSRLVGEEMFDVKSVNMTVSSGGSDGVSRTLTVGNSESLTEGTGYSIATGESRTVTDTDSHNHTHGQSSNTSRSRTRGQNTNTSEGVSFNTGESVSRSRGTNRSSGGGDGTQSGGSRGTSGEHTALDYLGIDLPIWQTKNRSDNWGSSTNRNWSQGINDSLSTSTNTGRSSSNTRSFGHSDSSTLTHGSSISDSISRGTSHADSHGTSRTETESRNQSRTTGASNSEATGTNQSKTWSKGQGYSVKPEQRKIETARSLRRTMSNGNQLLAMRGHFAFLAPRMLYFERAGREDFYRFPQIAILSGETTVQDTWKAAHQVLKAPAPMPTITLGSENDSGFSDLIQRLQHIEAQAGGPHAFSRSQRDEAMALMNSAAERINALGRLKQELADAAIALDSTEGLLAFTEFLMGFCRHLNLSNSLTAVDTLCSTSIPPLETEALSALRQLLLFETLWSHIHSTTAGMNALEDGNTNAFLLNGSWLLKQYDAAFIALGSALRDLVEQHKRWRNAYAGAVEELQNLALAIDQQITDVLFKAALRQIERRRKHSC